MKTLVVATITNHGVKVGDTSYCYGIPESYFPSPRIPGAMFKLHIEFIGTDPEIKPELHAYWPSSSFAGICKSKCELELRVKECKSALRKVRDPKERKWWQLRLKKLREDLARIEESKRNHAAAVRLWKKHLIK